MEEIREQKRFAVLIDADNISSKYAGIIFNEINEYGLATYRRIYGNWAKSNGWNEKILLENSIQPIQQFAYTVGKNSTDMAMVIDAMDIFYSGKVDGFCIVTSDSDFTRLAMRLREGNMFVIGMGASKAPDALTKSCNKFVYLDILAKHSGEESETAKQITRMVEETTKAPAEVNGVAGQENQTTKALDKNKSGVTKLKKLEKAISDMIGKSDSGQVGLGEVGSRLTNQFPDFDVRNYGYSKLSTLIGEKFSTLKIQQNEKGHVVRKNDFIEKEQLEKEIIKILKDNQGRVKNISLIQEAIKKSHPGFDVKDYGYSKLSSLIKSMQELRVVNNSVTLSGAEDTIESEIIHIIEGKGSKDVHLSQVCAELLKKHPDFTTKKYGCKNFSTFLKTMNSFVVDKDRVSLN